MVVKRRLLLAVASAMTLVMTAAVPMMGATKEAKPNPLRAENLLRAKAIAAGTTASTPVVAVGWHEAAKPGRLYLTFSKDGGKNYRKNNGNLRRSPVVGVPALGMSMDICAGRIWVGTAYSSASDKAGDSDVFMTSRRINGAAAQALMTDTSADRRVRDVSVTCVGNDLIAIGWLEKKADKYRARVMLRSTQTLGTTPKFKRTYNLGTAEFGSGLAIAGTTHSLAVAFVRGGDMRLKRFSIGDGIPPSVTRHALQTIATKEVREPVLAASGERMAVAWSASGRVKAKVSTDLGKTFSGPRVLVPTGGLKKRSRPYSVDVVGDRIVVEAAAWAKATGKYTPQRIQSLNGGATWGVRSYGHAGARFGALFPGASKSSLLMETWHNNAPKGARDTLRARYELR